MRKKDIPKDRDIEEYIEEIENQNNSDINSMDDVIAKMDQAEKSFKESLKVRQDRISDKKEIDEKAIEKIEKKIERHEQNKRAQRAEKERRIDILKAMNKIEENSKEDENEKEIQEFFLEAKRKIKEYEENQNQAEKVMKNEKFGDKYDKAIERIYQKEQNKEQKTKKNNNKRLSGSSMKEIFDSDEFKKMWKDAQGEER